MPVSDIFKQLKTQKVRSFLIKALAISLLFYQLIGAFSIAPVELDGIRIATGVTTINSHGIESSKEELYAYDVQAGTYLTILRIHQLTSVNPFTIFSILSTVGCLSFIFFGAQMVSYYTNSNFWVALVCILLFQEALVNAYYPNSNVFAAPFLIMSVYFLTQRVSNGNVLLSAMLLAFGVWMRIDSIMISLIFPLLLFRQTLAGFLRRSSLFALTFITVFITLSQLSNVELSNIFGLTQRHMEGTFGGKPMLGILGQVEIQSYLSFYSLVNIVMIGIGIIYLLRTNNLKLLSSCLVAILPLVCVYFGDLSSPKYLFYVLPFYAIFTASALKYLKGRPVLSSFVVFLWMSQYLFFGIQTTTNNGEFSGVEIGDFIVSPKAKNIQPYLLNTDDGKRMLSGKMLLPVAWYLKKLERNTRVKELEGIVSTYNTSRLDKKGLALDTHNDLMLLSLILSQKNIHLTNKEGNMHTYSNGDLELLVALND